MKPELVRQNVRRTWSADGPEARALVELVRCSAGTSAPSEQQAARAFARHARQHVDARARWTAWLSSPSLRYALAFAATLLIALASLKLLGSSADDAALSYQLKSGASAGPAIEAKAEPLELDFSDGTVVTALPATRASVTETTRRGARFRLDSGRMTFDVVPHRERGSWQVDAGPFQVHVTGTVFMVEWLAAEGSLRVDVTRGHVVVEGAGQRRELGAGDSFQHRERLTDDVAARVGASVSKSAPVAATSNSLEASERADAPARGAEKAASWSALVTAGDYAAVLESATQRGLQACLDGCSASDLRALSDAARLAPPARLARSPQLAERVLLAQRARFAGTADAAAAAFLLGRRAEQRRDPQAVAWYERYLREAPRGRFAADALGRKMMLVAGANPGAAQALAEQYLARFPAGPYVAHAHSLIEAARGSR